jgi:hypothetical protein
MRFVFMSRQIMRHSNVLLRSAVNIGTVVQKTYRSVDPDTVGECIQKFTD